MIKIQITTMLGTVQQTVVQQIEFVRVCAYSKCQKEFLTIDADKKYCKKSHSQRAYEIREVPDREAYLTPLNRNLPS